MTKPLSPTKFVPRRVENYAISSADDLGEGTSAMTELGRRVEALKVAEAEPVSLRRLIFYIRVLLTTCSSNKSHSQMLPNL